MNILVTGGNGFIGSNFITLLQDERPDWKIYNFDCKTYASNDLHENIDVDISDVVSIEEWSALNGDVQFDYIVNFAAESHVDNSIENPGVFVNTNVMGTLNMLNLAREHESRYLQVSTDEVYGSLRLKDPSFTEETLIKPNSPYSASKASADMFVRSYVETFDLDAVITRCSNNYGIYQHTEKLIPKIITNILNGEKIPVYGDGSNIRDWIHVSDHCTGILTVLEQGSSGEVYNIGTDNEISNINIVKTILKLMNESEDLIEFVGDRLGHDFRYSIDSSKMKYELGWEPEMDFEEGILQTIDWYSSKI